MPDIRVHAFPPQQAKVSLSFRIFDQRGCYASIVAPRSFSSSFEIFLAALMGQFCKKANIGHSADKKGATKPKEPHHQHHHRHAVGGGRRGSFPAPLHLRPARHVFGQFPRGSHEPGNQRLRQTGLVSPARPVIHFMKLIQLAIINIGKSPAGDVLVQEYRLRLDKDAAGAANGQMPRRGVCIAVWWPVCGP